MGCIQGKNAKEEKMQSNKYKYPTARKPVSYIPKRSQENCYKNNRYNSRQV